MKYVKRSLQVPAQSGLLGRRVDHYVQELTGWSRAQVHGLFDHLGVTVNDSICVFPGYKTEPGDQLLVRFNPHQRYHPRPRPRWEPGCPIIFEDEHLLVVLKPAEWLTVPTRRNETNTLIDRLTQYLQRTNQGSQAFHVHRLDRGVSGLLLVSKTESLAAALRNQFAARKPQRDYVALVAGSMNSTQGTFDTLLATDRDLNRFSTDDAEIGQRAITHYQVQQAWPSVTLVKVWLETGRRNQIRVHFAEHGHPVLGDPRYEADAARSPLWPFERIALHARRLAFQHPATGRVLSFTSPLPAEMEYVLQSLTEGPPEHAAESEPHPESQLKQEDKQKHKQRHKHNKQQKPRTKQNSKSPSRRHDGSDSQ